MKQVRLEDAPLAAQPLNRLLARLEPLGNTHARRTNSRGSPSLKEFNDRLYFLVA